MIVLDASALVELLLETPSGHRVAALIADPAIGLHVPHLADIEVTQALRRYARDGDIGTADAETAISALHSLDLQRHAHEPLLDRVWELRHHMSAYDAAYVALAEALEARLITCDGRLARAPGGRARIELVKDTRG